MAKDSRIVIRLEHEMRVKLHAKAQELGLDDAAWARSLIYQTLNGGGLDLRRSVGLGYDARADLGASAGLAEEPEALLVEEMDIPADADGGEPQATLDDLMTGGVSLLDNMLASAPPRSAVPSRNYRRPVAVPIGPGSKTRAVGVNGQAVAADPRGNVLAENMRHFGLTPATSGNRLR